MCDAQVSALQQLAVGRDDVSDEQRHDVAHDKLFGRNLPLAGTDCVLASWRPLCERCFSAV